MNDILVRLRNLISTTTTWPTSYSSSMYNTLMRTSIQQRQLQTLTVSDDRKSDSFEDYSSGSGESVLLVEVEELKTKLIETNEKLELYMIMVEQLFDIISRKDALIASQDQSVARLFRIVEEFIKTLHSDKMKILFGAGGERVENENDVHVESGSSPVDDGSVADVDVGSLLVDEIKPYPQV